MEMPFGCLAGPLQFETSFVSIVHRGSASTLVEQSTRTSDGWFYPPLQPEWMSATDLGHKHITLAPLFFLPNTHSICLPHDNDDELAACLIAVLGVLKGLQLVPEGYGHFYRTPIEPGTLADFRSTSSACERLLLKAREWCLANPTLRKSLLGACHWHLFGPSYQHSFEQFGVAYSVLDTCWRIHATIHNIRKNAPPHAKRPLELCRFYDLATPPWAEVSGTSSPLAELRNEYVHESLWGGEPIGYAHPQETPDIALELFWFNARLLIAMIGDRSEYTRSTLSGQQQLLE